ncbi:MAG: hypothetical protein JSV04_01015 [Candidatus Heimdallarchaeota archaeon]|nr:MAG: hypothetical protein JSV04_01015 [Candidatus Heimdallarchaeota archaeon]
MSPKPKKTSQSKSKRSLRVKRKKRRTKDSGGPVGDGVLFPSTRTPSAMNKKTAKKLKKATRYKL